MDHPLKCKTCGNYLNVPPIVFNDALGNICGRENCKAVSRETGKNYRQIAFEALAKDEDCPCINADSGCPEVMALNAVSLHEKVCHFVEIKCPFSYETYYKYENDGQCVWEGMFSELWDHMKEFHKDHFFENEVQIKLPRDITKNKIFFSKMGESIVVLLGKIQGSSSHWKVWTSSEMWKKLKYKIELTKKGKIVIPSKFRDAGILYPSFFTSEPDEDGFKLDRDFIFNFLDSPTDFTVKFYINDYLVGPSQITSPKDEVKLLKTIKCDSCGDEMKQSNYVCRSERAHCICEKCKIGYCKSEDGYNCNVCTTSTSPLHINLAFESLQLVIAKQCKLCSEKVDSFLPHLKSNHLESLLNRDEFYQNLHSDKYFYSYNDDVILFSKKFTPNYDLIFSIQCLYTQNLKYKYELTLSSQQTGFCSVIFTDYCHPELIDFESIAQKNIGSISPETFVEGHLVYKKFPHIQSIAFKLSISPIVSVS